MLLRRLSVALALSFFVASSLAADVGFRLPPGALSRASTAKGTRIRQDVLPWGPDGNTAQPNFPQLAAARYGGTFAPDTKAPDVAGLHVTDYEAALIMIATKDPEWCRQFSEGPCHPGTPTQQESHDAQYWSFGGRVIQRARELGLSDAPPPDGKIPVKLTGPDLGEPGQPLAYGVEGCDPVRPFRWSAPGGFVRGRGNAVTITFPEKGVFTVAATGSGSCGSATMIVNIGDVETPPPPPPPPPDPAEPPPPPPPPPPAGNACEEVLRELEPLLRQMLDKIESGRQPAEPRPAEGRGSAVEEGDRG